ncbi:MAG: low molecular weight protein-tyrosine-phosphatase [Actinomycetes bacterium]
MRPVRLLFVCLGNICRSPTAEAVMRAVLRERRLDDVVEVDSAGTGDWHVGSPPDPRACAAAARRGVDVTGSARQVTADDFSSFDLLLAMDASNARELRRVAPPGTEHKVRLLADVDVPDPYYGGDDGFERVLDLVDDACRRLLDELDLRQA